jgi:hypothetical protein
VAIPDRTDDWAADARTLVLRWRATMLRHPWSPPLLGRPMLGPNVLARTEFLQSTLARTTLTGPALTAATHGLANLTIGAALTESTWHGAPHVPQTTANDHVNAHSALYPTLAANNHLATPNEDTLFATAVDTFLRGLPH